jgi:hypothetical protein
MLHAINLIIFAIMTLASVVMAFIAFIDSFLAALMNSAGIPPNVQLILLVVAAVILVIVAVRALGRVFAGLIIVLLLLLVVHKAFPALDIPHGHTPVWLHTPTAPLPHPPDGQ